MRRREFIALMGASVAWPFAAMAQQAGRTYRVGGLSVGPRNAPVIAAMFDELRRFGFIEGQNLTIDWRQYSLHIDLISEFAATLSNPRSMSFMPSEMLQFELHSGRQQQFRSSGVPTIWSRRDW